MTMASDIERESFNELITSHRLKALAAKIEGDAPAPGGRSDGTFGVSHEVPAPPENLRTLATLLGRLTFSEMMTLTEGVVAKLADKATMEPFALAIGLSDWGKSL